jgi:hypothetical protein
MSVTISGNPSPAPAWHIEQLRLTVFASAPAPTDYEGWWAMAARTTPDSVNDQPKQALHQEIGTVDEVNRLVLQVQQRRIDWLLVPEPPATDFATIGLFPEGLNSFVLLMKRWLPSCPGTDRLALGGVLFQPQPDKIAAYLALAKYLPMVKLDPDSSDLTYQINRPRVSQAGVRGLRINRLTKWSVMQLQQLTISPTPTRVQVEGADLRIACRMEFDINSVPEFQGPLPKEKLSELVDEFALLTQEIAERGDTS